MAAGAAALLPVLLALAGAAVAHAGLQRLESRLPLWIARRRAADAATIAQLAARARAPARLAMLVPKGALWLAALSFAADRFAPLEAARELAAGAVRMSFETPVLEAQGRSWTALELIELPLLLAATWIGVGLLARALRWQIVRTLGTETGAGDALATLARYALGIVAALVVLQAWGFDLRSFALVGGVVGVGLGFGLQNITSNFVSGLLLAIERPIQPGHFVRVGEFTGTVQRIGARSTEIRTPDRISILVPNSRFLEAEVVNWSHGSPVCRLHVPVGLAYGSDPARARAALVEAVEGHPKVLADPRPDVDLDGFGDSALLFDLEVWTDDPATQHDTISDLHYRIADSLKRHGLEVPFPQQDVRFHAPALERLAEAIGQRDFPGWEARPEAPASVPDHEEPILPPRPTQWSDAQLEAVVERLRAPDGVMRADRRHLLKVHPRCFVGAEAVDWLVAHEGLTRAEATALGRRLVARGFLHHVLDEHDFEDARLFYRFLADETEAIAAAAEETRPHQS